MFLETKDSPGKYPFLSLFKPQLYIFLFVLYILVSFIFANSMYFVSNALPEPRSADAQLADLNKTD